MKKRLLSTLLATCMVLTLLPVTAWAADSDDVEYTDASDWLLSDAYYDEAEQCYVLTEDYATWETGSIWYNHPCYGDFSLEMDYYTGSTNRALSGADGIAVAFYANYEYTMAGGEELGFNGSKGYGVELDTYYNSNRGDPNYNHIALIKESVGNHLITERLSESEDEQWHHLKIVVDDGICSAYVDSTLKFSHAVESTGYGWIGITAATGNGENLHAVRNIAITDDGTHTVDNYLDIKLSNTMISDSGGQYKYEITADVKNSGGATAENVTVTLDLAEQLHISDSMPLSYALGDIDYEESRQTTWTVYANWPATNTTAIYGVTADINNVVSLRQEDYIYLKSKSEDSNAFIFGIDQWSFSNDGKYFTDGNKVYDSNGKFVSYVESYFLNDTDYKALTAGLGNLEKESIYQAKNDHWNGSCYGMSDVAILTKIGIIKPSSIPSSERKNTLYKIEMLNNDSVESFISFYFLEQFLIPAKNDVTRFMRESTTAQLQEIEEKAQTVSTGGVPVLLSFCGEEGGHAVVAYGVEHGEFTLNDGFLGTTLFGTKYDSRILIYDCNYPEGSKYSYLWYNTGTDEWCIPNYPWATKLKRACNDIAILDCINHNTAVSNYTAWLDFKGDAAGYFFEQAGLLQFIDNSTDERENGLVTFYDDNYMLDGNGNPGTLHLILPDSTDSYSVAPLDGEASDFTLYYENSALSAVTEEADRIDFSSDGKIGATGVSGEYSMSLITNEGYSSLPWYKTSISGADSASISMEQVENGIIIAGSDLKDVVVTVENDDQTRSLQFTTDKESVLVASEASDDGIEPVIMLDSNDDGVYDEVYGIYYTITLKASPAEGGTVTGGGTYDDDASVTVTATANSGYRFVRWAENGQQVSAEAAYTFTAEGDRTLTAVFERTSIGTSYGGGGGGSSSGNSYQITAPAAENGTVTVNPKSAKSGEKVTITAKPDNGYTIGSVTVTGSSGKSVSVTDNGDGTYIFTMPSGKVTVNVTFALVEEETAGEPWGNPFTDVSSIDWFYEYVAYVVQNGIMSGYSDGTFRPDSNTTRQALWMVLCRMAGADPVNMAEAREWAINAGISDGTNPENSMSRQQMVAMLYRYALMKGYKTDGGMSLSSYPDATDVAPYAQDAMAWAVGNNIVTGTSDGKLNPQGTASRAHFAAFLYRFASVAGL